MVCISEPLPIISERIDFIRLLVSSFNDNSQNNSIEELVIDFDTEKSEVNLSVENAVRNDSSYTLKDFLLESAIKNLILLGSLGLIYGACRLAEYYGIIETYR